VLISGSKEAAVARFFDTFCDNWPVGLCSPDINEVGFAICDFYTKVLTMDTLPYPLCTVQVVRRGNRQLKLFYFCKQFINVSTSTKVL
jgi:hypothetical protein